MTVKTIVLPPAERPNGLAFDQSQFSRRRKERRIATAETGLTFDDAKGMSIRRTNQNNNAWGVPPWTASDEKVQRVVALQLWKMVHMSFAMFPEERFQNDRLALVLELEKELDRRCVSFVEQGNGMIRTGVHTYKVAKDFGYAKILTQVIYSKYRLGKAANTIVADLNDMVSPCGVRQLANRLCHTARVVFDEQDAPPPKRAGATTQLMLDRWREQYSRKEAARDELQKVVDPEDLRTKIKHEDLRDEAQPVGRGGHVWTPDRLKQLFALRTSGSSYKECAKILGYEGDYRALAQIWQMYFPDKEVPRSKPGSKRNQPKPIDRRKNITIPLTNLELYQLTVNGRTHFDIAQEYGANPAAVRARVASGKREFAGLPPIDRTCKKKLILSMHLDGIDIVEIAREVKRPLAYVDCIIRNFGPASGPEPCDCED
jgi:hypothetical protein